MEKMNLDGVCPVCGGPRGEVIQTLSYDGRLIVDKYYACREEYAGSEPEPLTPLCTANHPLYSRCLCSKLKGHDGPHSALIKGSGEKFSTRSEWVTDDDPPTSAAHLVDGGEDVSAA